MKLEKKINEKKILKRKHQQNQVKLSKPVSRTKQTIII